MTEAEWLACGEPGLMLEFLRGKASDRKLRLFACACCRQVWQLLGDKRQQQTIETAERYADGECSLETLAPSYRESEAIRDDLAGESQSTFYRRGVLYAADAVAHAASSEGGWGRFDAGVLMDYQPVWQAVCAAGRVAQARAFTGRAGTDLLRARSDQSGFLRDIFGNPFRVVSLTAALRTPIVVTLARAAYDERILPGGELDIARLAVLADALEESGCSDRTILEHLRSPGPHCRGCFAVDLILAKE